MDEYEFINIDNEDLLLIVASTFGNGNPPDNGKVRILDSLQFLC